MIPEGYSRSDNIIKSFNWIFSCLSYVWTHFFNRFIDPVLWVFTGTSMMVVHDGKERRIRRGFCVPAAILRRRRWRSRTSS